MERREFLQKVVFSAAAMVVSKCMPEYTGGNPPSVINPQRTVCPPGMEYVETQEVPVRTDGHNRVLQTVTEDVCLGPNGPIGFTK